MDIVDFTAMVESMEPEHVFALLRTEIDGAQALCGLPDITEVTRDSIRAGGVRV